MVKGLNSRFTIGTSFLLAFLPSVYISLSVIEKRLLKSPFFSISSFKKSNADQYSFFNEYTTKNDVIIFEYKKIDTLKSNDFFGDNNFENRGPMNETFIAEEECDMAVLPNKLYSEQIASEKNILMDKKIYDLHQNHFFRQIKYGKFSKKYFKLFINEKFHKNEPTIIQPK